MNLNEIHDLLLQLDNDDTTINVVIEPPVEAADADTDCDSDASDDANTCDPNHLPQRVLRSQAAIANLPTNENEPDSSQKKSIPVHKKRKLDVNWHKNKEKIENSIPDYEGEVADIPSEMNDTALEVIEKFFTDEWIEYICEQSKVYAQQKSLAYDQVNPRNFKVFLGILILSGFNRLPYRRLYWSESPEVGNDLVKNSMRRATFEQLMRCLHFSDNMSINDDRFYKVRPLFEHINKVFKAIKSKEFTSVDEIMVPYYGKHGDKQYIRGKPVRFGFKLWAACTSAGSLLFVEPYCGSHTHVTDRDAGHGGNVVLESVEQLKLSKGQHIVCDNFFGSIQLLKKLTERQIAGTCTMREDRLAGAPLKSKKILDKEKRGSMDEAYTGNISLVKWKDNKVVSVASNKERCTPLQKVERWDKTQKKRLNIDMPNSIHIYNKHMGGVDLFDQQVSAYRIRIRSKKWWWCLFSWCVTAQVVNAWNIYRQKHNKVQLLDYAREISLTLLKSYGTPRVKPGPKLSQKVTVSSVRYNTEHH